MAYKGKQPIEESGADVAELELERKREILRKAKIRTEKILGNRGAVKDGDPSKHYVWVNRDESRQNWYIGLGYRLCKTAVLGEADASAATRAKIERANHEAEIEAKKRGLSGKAWERFIDDARRAVTPVVKWPSTDWEKEDGTHRRGDLILYEIDKDEKEALAILDEAKGLEMTESYAERWRVDDQPRA